MLSPPHRATFLQVFNVDSCFADRCAGHKAATAPSSDFYDTTIIHTAVAIAVCVRIIKKNTYIPQWLRLSSASSTVDIIIRYYRYCFLYDDASVSYSDFITYVRRCRLLDHYYERACPSLC